MEHNIGKHGHIAGTHVTYPW